MNFAVNLGANISLMAGLQRVPHVAAADTFGSATTTMSSERLIKGPFSSTVALTNDSFAQHKFPNGTSVARKVKKSHTSNSSYGSRDLRRSRKQRQGLEPCVNVIVPDAQVLTPWLSQLSWSQLRPQGPRSRRRVDCPSPLAVPSSTEFERCVQCPTRFALLLK